MKRILCALLTVLLLFGAVALTACNEKPEAEKLKLGLGVYSYYSKATNADAANENNPNGQGQVVAAVAAVLIDKDGKIVKCELDTADNTVQYTSEGKFITPDSFKTKYELGEDYNMVEYGKATQEWYKQADAFEGVVAGKTLEQVKALVATANKGTEEVINAGCTIMVHEFVLAIEKAVKNAKASEAVADSTLKLGVVTEVDTSKTKDATEDGDGAITLNTDFVASATDADGKVVATVSDCLSVKFGFNNKGAATTDTKTALSTKLELGDKYGMKSPYGSEREWYEHAAAFDTTCIGKTAKEIAGLATDGKAGEALQNAGCTIGVSGAIKAAVKAATKG